MLYDIPAAPGDMYERWRTYLCTVVGGEEAPGIEPEDDSGDAITAVAWLDLHHEEQWSDTIRTDHILAPQLRQIRSLFGIRPTSTSSSPDL